MAGEIPRTHSLYFSFDKGMDTGVDTGMPAYENYKTPKGAFSGTIEWAEITLGDDDHSVFSNGGTAIVIHAVAGGTGTAAPARIACGIISKP